MSASGAPIDLGCGWLHSADENPLVALAEAQGLTIDRSRPPWTKQAFDLGFPPEDQAAYREAFTAFDEKIHAAAHEPDRPASELLPPGDRWNPLLDAFSGYYNGAPFRDISVQDYAAYHDSGLNWRVREGYGTAIAGLAADLPIAYGAAVTRIDRRGARLRLETPEGVVEARAVIVTLPSAVLAAEGLKFDPPLPDKLQAAFDLPLGHVDKAFLAVAAADDLPQDSHLYGRTDTALTASFHLRPFGRPMIEAFFGGDLADDLERRPKGAFADFAIQQLVDLLGSDFRRRLTPIEESDWGTDPYTLGAYSHARPGRRGARGILAAPVEERLFFAGEATSADLFSTAHGAWLTGLRAAEEAIGSLG
jgi:monoamine oxidase